MGHIIFDFHPNKITTIEPQTIDPNNTNHIHRNTSALPKPVTKNPKWDTPITIRDSEIRTHVHAFHNIQYD